MPSSSHSSRPSSKKIIVYAIIGIIAVAAVSVSVFARPQDRLQEFRDVWCGSDASLKSTAYITEVALPSDCQMPVGIAVDGNQVWYVSAKRGLLGRYSITDNNFNQYVIPQWPSREQPFTQLSSWSTSWTVKVDRSGNVWFTDQNNAIWRFHKDSKSFDMFKVSAIYPSTLDFDKEGNIYFIGIDSKSIYFGDVSRMKNGTSDGIREIPLPLGAFSRIDPRLVTSGLLVVDNVKNKVWVSLLAYQAQIGQIFRYDVDGGKVDRIVDLPKDLGAPVGATVDNSGNLWVADHGTSIFYKYDPTQDNITKFVTSVASSRIYGGTTPPNAYTLPYWFARAEDGSLWFNEHFGNKIARFDPEKLVLTEYWIPSQNKNWAACPSGSKTCGLANALQFGLGSAGGAWFSEQTENKIGKLDSMKKVPIEVSAPSEVTVARGNSGEIKITINPISDFSGRMMVSGTFMPNGMLGNSTGIFSEESLSISAVSKQVSLTFTPAENLTPGEYVMMVGAGNDDVSVLKAVKVNVT